VRPGGIARRGARRGVRDARHVGARPHQVAFVIPHPWGDHAVDAVDPTRRKSSRRGGAADNWWDDVYSVSPHASAEPSSRSSRGTARPAGGSWSLPTSVTDAVLQHQERLDGSGYPGGIKDDDIGEFARVVAVADVVEAMSSHRPYRPAIGVEPALEEIEQGRGERSDERAADACLPLFRDEGFAFTAWPARARAAPRARLRPRPGRRRARRRRRPEGRGRRGAGVPPVGPPSAAPAPGR
jgi:hypothetical protein